MTRLTQAARLLRTQLQQDLRLRRGAAPCACQSVCVCSPARPLTRARFTDRPRRPQIHFRPLHLEEYDDCIEFTTEKGVFVVPIKANIPTMSSKVPTNIDFGFCPVQETETKTFAATRCHGLAA